MYKKQIIIPIFFLITSFLVSAIPVEAEFSEDQFKSISTLLINNQLDFLNNGQTVPPVFIECTNGIHNQSPRVNSIQQANQVCRDTRNREQLLFNCIRRETTYSCANRVSASQVNQQPSGNVQQEQTRIRETSLNFSPQQFRFQERTFSGECSISNTMNNLAVCRRPDAGSQRYYGCVDSVDPLATVRFNCSVDKGIINTDVNSINDINISQSEFESLENQAFDPGGIGSPVTSSSASTTAGTVTYESYTNFPGVGRISSLCQLITALWLLGFAVLLTSVLGMFLWGGYIYVTAGVNAGKVNQAKEIFTNTITGLIIGLSIFIIINVINPGLLQGNCSIPPIGSTGTGAGQPTLGGGGGTVSGPAFNSGLFTGPSDYIGGSADYHIDTKIPKSTGWETIDNYFLNMARGYAQQGRVIEFSNAGVAGERYDPSAPQSTRIDLLQRAAAAHAPRSEHSWDYYVPLKGENRFGKSVEGVEFILPSIPGGRAEYSSGGNYGNYVTVYDSSGRVAYRTGHGDNRRPLPATKTFP